MPSPPRRAVLRPCGSRRAGPDERRAVPPRPVRPRAPSPGSGLRPPPPPVSSAAFLLGIPEQHAEPVTERRLEVREWTRTRPAPEHLEQIGSWPTTLDLEVEGGLELRAFHGSPRSYDDVLLPEAPDSEAERLL